MKDLSLIRKLSYLNLRTQMEYRASFFIWLIIKVLNYGSDFLIIWLILDRFNGIGNWSIPEVLVLWSLMQLTYTIAAPFLFHSAGKLEEHINKGNLDYYLVQPLNPLTNLIARNFSWTYSSQTIMSLIVLCIALNASGFIWSIGKVSFLVLTVIGGVCFYAFTFLLGGAISFRWLHSGRSIMFNIHWTMDLAQYPMEIYPKAIQAFFTFVIPAAMLNYYPTIHLLDKEASLFHPALPILSPFIQIGLGMIGFKLFRQGLNYYQSGGG